MCRFHLKEYPDYKYQPRKRPAVTAGGHDTSAGSRSHRRSTVKRLCTKKSRKKPARLVPRCETPLSTADSEVSEVAESYLSSDWSVANDWEEDEDGDVDVSGTGTEIQTHVSSYKPADQTWSSSLGPSSRVHFTAIDSVPAFPAACGRSCSSTLGFDWMEDYMTPEVVDLLADDWFVAAENICLRDVVVM